MLAGFKFLVCNAFACNDRVIFNSYSSECFARCTQANRYSIIQYYNTNNNKAFVFSSHFPPCSFKLLFIAIKINIKVPFQIRVEHKEDRLSF